MLLPNLEQQTTELKRIQLLMEDGTQLEANHYVSGAPNLIIVVHGFFQNKDNELFKGISGCFIPQYDVLTIDMRGHGKSQGQFTLTSKEADDLVTILNHMKKNYEKIGVIGFSLGAAVSIVAAGKTQLINSLIAVSAPMSFSTIDGQFWRKEAFDNLIDNLSPEAKGKGVCLGNPFLKKPKPIDYAPQISNCPVLLIHGTHDWLIDSRHSLELYEHIHGTKDIRIVEMGLHAEKLFEQDPKHFKEWTNEWFQKTLKEGRLS